MNSIHEVASTGHSPEIGGKKTARIARKRSEPHIARWRGFPLYEVVPNVIFNVNIAVVSSQ